MRTIWKKQDYVLVYRTILFMMTIAAGNRAFAVKLMAISAIFMRPFFTEFFDFARFGCADLFSVFGDRDIVMTDEAFTNSLCLMLLMIECHTVFELNNVGGNRTG